MENKRKIRYLTGFTLAETIISIALLVMLVFFMAIIVPPLIMKFRASAFKEQTLFLAKNKLEEYLYAAQPETIAAQQGAFGQPYEKFYYNVQLSDYGTADNLKQVTITTWGPTNNVNIRPNRVVLTGLAKIASSGGGGGIPEWIGGWLIDSNLPGIPWLIFTANFVTQYNQSIQFHSTLAPGNHAMIRVDKNGYLYIISAKISSDKFTFAGWKLTKYDPGGALISSIDITNRGNVYGMALWKNGERLYAFTDNHLEEWDISGLIPVKKGKVLEKLFPNYWVSTPQATYPDNGSSHMPAGKAYIYDSPPSNPFDVMLGAPFDVDEEGNFYVYSGYAKRAPGGNIYTNNYAIIKINREGNLLNDPVTGKPCVWAAPTGVYNIHCTFLNDIRVIAPNEFYTINRAPFPTNEYIPLQPYSTFQYYNSDSLKNSGFGYSVLERDNFWGVATHSLPDEKYVQETKNGQVVTGATAINNLSNQRLFPYTMAVTPDGEAFVGGITTDNALKPISTKSQTIKGSDFYRFKIKNNYPYKTNAQNGTARGNKYFSIEARFGYNERNPVYGGKFYVNGNSNYGGFQNLVVDTTVSQDGKYLYVIDTPLHSEYNNSNYYSGRVNVFKLKD